DDELGIREGCLRVLAEEGYAIELAEDGMAGLAKVQEKPFDLILVDLMMPGIGGLDLIQRIHELDPEIILVVITGYAAIETAVEATKRGAYEYLSKPFTPEALSVLVRRGLEKRDLRLEARRLYQERELRLLELAGEKSRLRSVIGCMADGVLVTNLEHQLVLWNASAVRMLELIGTDEPGKAIGHYLRDPALVDALERIMNAKDDGFSMISQEIRTADTSSVLMAQMAPVRDEQGRILGAVTVLRDITRLKEIDKVKSQFVSMVAHELRAPLAAIEGWLEVVLSGEAGGSEEQNRAWLLRAKERANSLLALVQDLLEINKIEAGKVAQKMESVQLTDVLAKIIEFFRPDAERHRVSLRMKPSAAPPAVQADIRDMEKLFTNLISNAIKYNVENGSVAIETSQDAHFVGVHIRDTGVGISSADLPRIFDDFFRAETKKRDKVSGTGLGLTIAKKIVDSHLGRIEVESHVGQGSTFSVYLPYNR
ncbi:MAG: response regulator, partial [Candidatus Aminicenantes bacterium]|nr:response regulator [Candidatus Aminicenantes bacterium]